VIGSGEQKKGNIMVRAINKNKRRSHLHKDIMGLEIPSNRFANEREVLDFIMGAKHEFPYCVIGSKKSTCYPEVIYLTREFEKAKERGAIYRAYYGYARIIDHENKCEIEIKIEGENKPR